MKTVYYEITHGGAIVALRFKADFGRGNFNLQIKPVLEILKSQIPGSYRTYDPNTYTWEIAIEYWPAYEAILKTVGFRIIQGFVTASTSEQRRVEETQVPKDYAENFFKNESATIQTKEDPALIAASLSKFLGTDVSTKDIISLKQIYRRKARELHPDLGGDSAQMSELNRLWTIFTSTSVN